MLLWIKLMHTRFRKRNAYRWSIMLIGNMIPKYNNHVFRTVHTPKNYFLSFTLDTDLTMWMFVIEAGRSHVSKERNSSKKSIYTEVGRWHAIQSSLTLCVRLVRYSEELNLLYTYRMFIVTKKYLLKYWHESFGISTKFWRNVSMVLVVSHEQITTISKGLIYS